LSTSAPGRAAVKIRAHARLVAKEHVRTEAPRPLTNLA
jgi:hypothetical protein